MTSNGKMTGRGWRSIRLIYITIPATLRSRPLHSVIEDDEETARVDMEEVEKKIRNMEDMLKVKDVSNDSSCEGGG